ncbi:MAG: response regulator [Verrucomicrobia bacterium]|nr:response regulator [Verrucomicrobiota bacterium]
MDFIFTETTLTYLSLTLLSASVFAFGLYDFLRGPRTPAKCSFAAFGFSVLLFAICSFGLSFFHQKWGFICSVLYLIPLWGVSACTTWLAYHFPRKLEVHPWEIKITLLIMTAVGLFTAYNCTNLLRSSFLDDHAHWANILQYSAPGVSFIWTFVLFFRQASYQFPEAKKRSLVLRLLNPQHQQLRSARNLCLISFFIPFLVCLVIDPTIVASATLIIFSVFVLFYLSASAERTSLQVKLVGIFLSLILLLLNFCGVLILRNDRHTAFNNLSYSGKGGALKVPENKSFKITSQNDTTDYLIESGPLNWLNDIGSSHKPENGKLVLPFKFPYFGEGYHSVFASIHGYVSFQNAVKIGAFDLHYGHRPLIIAALVDTDDKATKKGGGLFTNISAERAVFSWINIPSRRNKALKHSFQIVLHSDGTIQLNYGEMQSRDIIYSQVDKPVDVRLYGFVRGDSSLKPDRLHFSERSPASSRITSNGIVYDQRLMIGQAGFPNAKIFILSLFIGCLIVLVGIPILFHQSLIRPLLNLLGGVRRVNKGNLDTTLPVLCMDEIGYLTSSFNRMTAFVNRSTKELELHRKLLESTVSERTKTLEIAMAQANEANKAKSVFLTSMSHELRTPLHPIIGFSQLVAKAENLTKDQQESLQIISASGNHLLSLIDNILQLGKSDAGNDKVVETEFDLNLLFDELKGMLSMHESSGDVPLHWRIPDDLPQRFRSDPDKIKQILLNLVGNSMKNTRSGSISVDCEWGFSSGLEKEDEYLRPTTIELTIADTGVGISENDMVNLFKPFFQGGVDSQTQKGAGLGLSICKHYVELLSGEMKVQSKLGLGTKVHLKLPVSSLVDVGHPARDESLEAELPSEVTFSSTETRILVAEDDPVNAKLIRAMLVPYGYELRIVTNGLLAVNAAQEWRPHLIWMDIRMPVMDGREAARQIKSLSSTECWMVRPVIIALTADAQQSALNHSETSVFDHLMIKPSPKEDLIAAINSFLFEKNESSDPYDKS